MTYTKTQWINNQTKINPTNMTHIEDGIVANETLIGDENTKENNVVTRIKQTLGLDENSASLISNLKLNSTYADTSSITTTQYAGNDKTYGCAYVNDKASTIPTESSISESGTNYIRFSDGTQICFDQYETTNSANPITTQFPKSFKSGTTPKVIVKAIQSRQQILEIISGVSNIQFTCEHRRISYGRATISGTQFNYMNVTSKYPCIGGYIAIGKWK